MTEAMGQAERFRWAQLRADVKCVSLPHHGMVLITKVGKTYRFGGAQAGLVRQLMHGVELTQPGARSSPELGGALVMLDELELLQYHRHQPASKGELAQPDTAPSTPAAYVPMSTAVAVMALAIFGWQAGFLAWLASGTGIVPLPKVDLLHLLQQSLMAWLLPFGATWIVAHELAHAMAARACGVRGGRVAWRRFLRLEFAFQAPTQETLTRPDVRFLIFCAGPVCDLVFAGLLALLWYRTTGQTADVLHALFLCQLLLGSMNLAMLGKSDMAQAMQALRALRYRSQTLLVLRSISVAYTLAILVLAAKLLTQFRM